MSSDSAAKVWVSKLNFDPHARPPIRRQSPVRFYDTTLRDVEQTVGVVFDPRQKLALARQIDSLGIARIEAGFPRVSPDDAEAIRQILLAGLHAEIWGFARAAAPDIDELIRLGLRSSVIEIPSSEIKLRAYGIAPDEAVRRASLAVRQASQAGIRVVFFPVDSTRANLDFLRRLYLEACAAGAAEVAVVDTIGACGPEAVELLISRVRDWLGPEVPLHFHGHNDFGLATACAISAVRAGADWIQGTINGMGERAGNADLAEVALALRCLYNVPVEFDLTRARTVSLAVQEAGRYSLEPWKPVVGENLFIRESGAVASQFHLPDAIEPFSADLVSAPRHIVLGKKSGLDSISLKAAELHLPIPDSLRAPILAAVKLAAADAHRLLTDAEFREIVARVTAARSSSSPS